MLSIVIGVKTSHCHWLYHIETCCIAWPIGAFWFW